MSLVSIEARNASLAMSYGALKGSSAPTELTIALYSGDPTNDGVPVTDDGVPVEATFDNDATTWPNAPDDGAVVSAPLLLGTSTEAYSDTGTHFLIRDADTGDWWDSGPLTEEVSVDVPGADVALRLTVYYNSLGSF